MEAVASLVRASPQDVVPVTNATTAINCVLMSLQLRKGDLILITNLTYPAVKSAAVRTAAAAGAGILELKLGLAEMQQPHLVLGILDQALASVRAGTFGGGSFGCLPGFEGFVGRSSRVRLAIFDHVVSFPPILLPIADLTRRCKQVCKVLGHRRIQENQIHNQLWLSFLFTRP